VGGPQLKAQAVTTQKVKDNNLTGTDVLESSLAQVPGADTLDGLDSTQLSPATADGRTADLALTGGYQTVLLANITTARSASLLVTAAVDLIERTPGDVYVHCRLRFDNSAFSVEYSTLIDHTSATLPVVWAHGVSAGTHTVELQCAGVATTSPFEITVDDAGMIVSAHL
jgi:hypothetical protein